MAEKMRYNKIIDLLEHGKPVFSTSTVPNGNLDDLTYIADADYDAVIIEMEHEGFSFTTLRTSLQVLLNRKRIAEKGNLQPDVVPMVRIPPNARERDQWVIKQALDTGVYGLVLPHLNTVEDAQAAVAAARYPQVPGGARLRTRWRTRLGQSHRLPLLGPDPAGILRRRRPLAAGP
jgi:4-hydroxy-2-oxoheptanedioate aldolase